MTELMDIRTYRGLTLDPFQQQAIAYIDQNESVLVAAPTGVGKTLIADYLIEQIHDQGRQVIYTAPIKALSNQKFKEFKNHMGEHAVGILTGDTVINADAPVLIMTTEIFRNMLQQSPKRVTDVGYVIFDEIHYIDDPQRGSVWEESLIFMPPGMRFLGLSATIPNIAQLADWISSVQEVSVRTVVHTERVVPLRHQLFEKKLGFTSLKKIRHYAQRLSSGLKGAKRPHTTHHDLISAIQDDYLPCLFFCFSRRKCELNALELGRDFDFLSQEQKQQADAVIREVLERYPPIGSERWNELRQLLLQGIAYHHAGMLPALKDIVEELFLRRLVPVLYCTETFAVGLNFPCKTVCFESVTKWDGLAFRPMSNREYFQMAGRAGRRGIDTEGFVFTMVDMAYFQAEEFPSMRGDQIEPLKSQFALTYNAILNLVAQYEEPAIFRILGQNFAAFQAADEREALQGELSTLEDKLCSFCEFHDQTSCPLVFFKLVRKRKHYQAQLKKARGAHKKRSIRERISSITATLDGIEPKDCSRKQQRKCVRQRKAYRRLLRQQEKLQQREQALDPQERFFQEFQDKKTLLAALGYLRGDQLTPAGEIAMQIHGQELLVTELLMEGFFHTADIPVINAVAVSVAYEPRKNEIRLKHSLDLSLVRRLIKKIAGMEEHFLGYADVQFYDHIALLAQKWSEGMPFSDLMAQSPIDEGDVVFAFRRGIDRLRQVRNATREDSQLAAKLRDCMEKMDRDEVSIWL